MFGGKASSFGDGGEDAPNEYVSNHTGYTRPGSENWEHDGTGNQMNYSNVVDKTINAFIEHEDRKKGEDF